MTPPERRSWVEVEPARVEQEREAMASAAPRMQWREALDYWARKVCGWEGEAPEWGGEREMPDGVDRLLGERRLRLRIYYPEAFPMVPPELVPLDPVPPIEVRGAQQWHVNPDGSLCTVQAANDWHPTRDSAADLVLKASGWFIEFLLLSADLIPAMSERGIGVETVYDEVLAGIQ